jgi:UDP:flavonoid glycosyltransferase YjiC (YdhE family)
VQPILDPHRDFWRCFFRNCWRIQDLIRLPREIAEPVIQRWEEISTTLKSLADGPDLLLTGLNFEAPAANVAEYCDIPLATLDMFPMRANGQFLPFLPAPLCRSAMTVSPSASLSVACRALVAASPR